MKAVKNRYCTSKNKEEFYYRFSSAEAQQSFFAFLALQAENDRKFLESRQHVYAVADCRECNYKSQEEK